LRGDLIRRDADVDVRTGRFARMDAGEKAGVRPRVITGSVAQRASIDMRQSAQYLHV
jgi:hypothetical protein